MDQFFSPIVGVGLLAGYFIFTFLLVYFTTRGKGVSGFTKLEFLVADRKVGLYPGAFSVAATWVWAPALMVSAQQAYINGWVGLFWFTIPNILTLVFFSYLALIIRDRVPDGYTISDYMRERFSSRRVHNIYLIELAGLSICATAVQMLAGGQIVASLTGIPFFWITVAFAAIALSYSLFSGIKASIITDYLQFALILIIGFTVIPWAVMQAGGLGITLAGIGGLSGDKLNLFSGAGGNVFWTFGLATTIGLAAAPVGDQTIWQRAFTYKRSIVQRAFIYGALFFGLVPLTMGIGGFTAAGLGMEVSNPALVHLDLVRQLLPAWAVVAFVYLLMCGLISTIDSNLCAISSLASHDGLVSATGDTEKRVLPVSRWSMVGLSVVALGIANIPGMQILYLFLFYGILRASVFLPTVITLFSKKLKVAEPAIFWGIVAALVIALPVFGYGNFMGITPVAIAGSLMVIGLSGGITWIGSVLSGRK